ncbi:YbfB/YjiJ family MFS transporter [uncultured Massilia sp.]|uniref:YbfB/YjiJ family MFS transporter n=1 Tax=uncultured Massilia sp. TaxID=169973 RepID=UPI0025FB917D|nr:YbfB/YjiJ family MFS transporter [uncultured Massilia sp.]
MQSVSTIRDDGAAVARAILAGLCASLVGIGLARFAYTPLIPALIQAHWFGAGDVVFLGAANLAGYLAGALSGRPLARRLGARRTLQLMMVLAALAFLACALPLSVAWFFAWRFLSGLSGGIIMVLAALTVLPAVPPARRGLASGAIFLGIGLGIAASGTLVPLLLERGLAATWTGLGLVSLALALASWNWWPQGTASGAAAVSASVPASVPAPAAAGGSGFVLRLIYGQYALKAVGLVPMMVFLVDYVARGLHMGTHAASMFWIVYGIGAIGGPVVYGMLGERLGTGAATRLTLLLQIGAAVALVAGTHRAVLVAATLVIGSFPSGIVPLTLTRIRQALHHDTAAQAAAWSRATTIFALFQALAGYACSWLFAANGGEHRSVLAVGAVALALALLSDLLLARAAHARLAQAPAAGA